MDVIKIDTAVKVVYLLVAVRWRVFSRAATRRSLNFPFQLFGRTGKVRSSIKH